MPPQIHKKIKLIKQDLLDFDDPDSFVEIADDLPSHCPGALMQRMPSNTLSCRF